MSELAPIKEASAIPPQSCLARVSPSDLIPEVKLQNRDKALFDMESAGAKQEFRLWQKIATVIERAPHNQKGTLMKEIAGYFGWHPKKIENRLTKWRKAVKSPTAHAFHAFIDRRRFKLPAQLVLPYKFRQLIAARYSDYKGRDQRGATQAILEDYIRQWNRWIKGDNTQAIDGWPVDQPPRGSSSNRGLPRGVNYDTFHKCRPDIHSRTLISQGPRAAHRYEPKVLTTRYDTNTDTMLGHREVVQHDDNWKDNLINPFQHHDSKRELRPISFASIDGLTTFQRCRIKSQWITDEGKRRNLSKIDYAWFLADDLMHGGYNTKTGTQVWGEGGTAYYDRHDELAEATNGKVTFHTGGGYGNPAFKELIYKCDGGGNFMAKPLIEGSFMHSHNRLSYLLGQVGPDPKKRPEETTGIQKYHHWLRAAADLLPEHYKHDLLSPILDPTTIFQLILLTIDQINARTQHNIEGWKNCKFTGFKWKLAADSDIWGTEKEFFALPADIQDAYRKLFNAQPHLYKRTTLSPAAAVQRVINKDIRFLNFLDAVNLLPEEAWFPVQCAADHCIHFTRQTIAPDQLHFYGHAINRNGDRIHLDRQKEYLALCNPYQPDRLVVAHAGTDSRAGSIIGIVPHIPASLKTDKTTFERQMEEVQRDNAKSTIEVRVQNQAEASRRKSEVQHNENIINQANRELQEAQDGADQALDDAEERNTLETPAIRESAASSEEQTTDRTRAAGASPTTQENQYDEEDYDPVDELEIDQHE